DNIFSLSFRAIARNLSLCASEHSDSSCRRNDNIFSLSFRAIARNLNASSFRRKDSSLRRNDRLDFSIIPFSPHQTYSPTITKAPQ
ncbi:MAG: hypothetical protein NW226_20695, partial [Microscillaceae bacterium]|nr:hypothetical protein [Microscillaceae bacterium]